MSLTQSGANTHAMCGRNDAVQEAGRLEGQPSLTHVASPWRCSCTATPGRRWVETLLIVIHFQACGVINFVSRPYGESHSRASDDLVQHVRDHNAPAARSGQRPASNWHAHCVSVVS